MTPPPRPGRERKPTAPRATDRPAPEVTAPRTAPARGVPPPGPAASSPEAESARRVTAFLRSLLVRRKGVLAKLAAWSAAESAQTFLGGYCVARSLDDGFLKGTPSTGLLWLAGAAVAILLGAPVVRGVFAQLPPLTEPLRDELVRGSVVRALRTATTTGGRADTTAVSRLTSQTEIARDSFAGLVLATRSFVFVAVGALAGLLSLAPQFLLVVLPPLVLGLALFTVSLRPMARAQHRYLDAGPQSVSAATTTSRMRGRGSPFTFWFREYTTRCRRSLVAKNPLSQPGREPVLPHAYCWSPSL